MLVKVDILEGILLDYALAVVKDIEVTGVNGSANDDIKYWTINAMFNYVPVIYNPSRNNTYSYYIHEYNINTYARNNIIFPYMNEHGNYEESLWVSELYCNYRRLRFKSYGRTELESAVRTMVKFHAGDYIDLPETFLKINRVIL